MKRLVLLLSCILATAHLHALAGEITPPKQASTVLFICEHGSSRSFVAATLFNRIAEQRGLSDRALSRAVSAQTVDKRVPPRLVASMAAEGVEADSFQPRPVTTSEADHAARIVIIGYDDKIDAVGNAPADHWNDIPAASLEYGNAKRKITSHIEELLRNLPATGEAEAGATQRSGNPAGR